MVSVVQHIKNIKDNVMNIRNSDIKDSIDPDQLDQILYRPLKIGTMEVSGRVFKSATSETRATVDGYVTDELIDFYLPMAKAGTPLIFTGNLCVSKQGHSAGQQASIDHDDKILGLSNWVKAVHAHGKKTKLIAQLNHGGRQVVRPNDEDNPVVSASNVMEQTLGTKPKALSKEQISEVIKDFVKAAIRAKKAGFDGIQLHFAHGYLISQFLAPYTNRRKDDYGGSLNNRMRFPLQIVREIRKNIGSDFPIIAKVNGTDALTFRSGATTHELIEFALALQNEGVDAIEISRAHYESVPPMLSGKYYDFLTTNIKYGSGRGFSSTRKNLLTTMAPVIESFLTWTAPKGEGYNIPYVKQFKKILTIPVIASGGFVSKDAMENAIIQGHSDAVSCARAFIADPYLYHNLYHKDFDYPICQYCNKCIARLGGMAVDCYEPEMSKKRQVMLDTDILF